MKTSPIIEKDLKTIADNISDISSKLSGKTLLITGGAGFLGNYFIGLIDYLNKNVLDKPCRVISVDNFVTGVKYRIDEGPNFRAIKHNIKEPLKLDEPVDYMIHAAGIASPKFYRELIIETIDVATMGTKNMLELANEKKITSMVFFSSSEVYGDPDPKFVPTKEDYWGNVNPIGARANYDESKRLGETLCVAYRDVHRVPVKMIRPFNVFGPGMRLDDYRVIPNFISNMLQKKPLPVYGDGRHTRTFCYITDAINGFMRVLLKGEAGEPYNVGNDDNEISMEALAQTIVDMYDGLTIEKIGGINDAYSKSDPKRRCPNLDKIKALGYEPKVDLKTGIKRFVEWAKETA